MPRITQPRLALLFAWAMLMALMARPVASAIDILLRPAAIRAEQPPPMPATAPSLVELRRLADWHANREARLQFALDRRPAGIAILALAAVLCIAWTAAVVVLWNARRFAPAKEPASSDIMPGRDAPGLGTNPQDPRPGGHAPGG